MLERQAAEREIDPLGPNGDHGARLVPVDDRELRRAALQDDVLVDDDVLVPGAFADRDDGIQGGGVHGVLEIQVGHAVHAHHARLGGDGIAVVVQVVAELRAAGMDARVAVVAVGPVGESTGNGLARVDGCSPAEPVAVEVRVVRGHERGVVGIVGLAVAVVVDAAIANLQRIGMPRWILVVAIAVHCGLVGLWNTRGSGLRVAESIGVGVGEHRNRIDRVLVHGTVAVVVDPVAALVCARVHECLVVVAVRTQLDTVAVVVDASGGHRRGVPFAAPRRDCPEEEARVASEEALREHHVDLPHDVIVCVGEAERADRELGSAVAGPVRHERDRVPGPVVVH